MGVLAPGDLQDLKFVRSADVYKSGILAGHLSRTDSGAVRFDYLPDYLTSGLPPVAVSLPLSAAAVESTAGALPAFFAGLLPEGHRLTVLKNATKTSFDDELTLLLAVGADVPGDVQVVPAGAPPAEPPSLADTSRPEELDFSVLANTVDLHGLPGVQRKTSASMLTTPLALRGHRYVLKLDPPEHPHLVVNEAAHLRAAKSLKIPVAKSRVIADRNGLPGLLVERFDRVRNPAGDWIRLPLEDGTQVLGLPPAAKYGVSSEQVAAALAGICKAPVVASRNLYLQFVFAWLTGNGDLHAKNLAVLGDGPGRTIAPVFDVPCTLLYGDETLALPVSGKTRNLKARHWAEFAATLGLPPRAAASANRTALAAAGTVRLEDLPFTGSPLRGAQRELGFRRRELTG
ncbi:type II toxin-antitoxin system HipA family toxin [Arthrobacter sp. H-02-3]|uniref:type II toxin-antitoxin system HipA family toxin n=1 Tax=Arthrobacter sp. H-02-3 TaxID=2703675 RepID=UPI000DD2B15D|nr:HipA domain-containing protein [Arthrobacter sp. H-02-3]PVZ53152.1 type II toxin-antitoxin system HipA family toxin [Arthrobacter sp. H-02-3]